MLGGPRKRKLHVILGASQNWLEIIIIVKTQTHLQDDVLLWKLISAGEVSSTPAVDHLSAGSDQATWRGPTIIAEYSELP